MKNSRLTAFEIIYGVLNNDDYSNLSLDSAFDKNNSSDNAFISKLVLGVIERRLTLDYILKPYLNSRPKPKVRILLYMGVYQLYFMDKVPSNAAVNETVELAKAVGCGYYTKLINAVLHKVDSNRIDIDTIDDLSARYSCPESLIKMWQKHYGEDNTLKILGEINNIAPVFAVPNTLFVDEEELLYELMDEKAECEITSEVVKINSHINVKKSRAFKNGLYHIQDLSSFNCAKALKAEEGQTVIDVCSAPGGKAFTVAERMNNNGEVYALDLNESRVKLIKEGAERLGIDIIKAAVNDAGVYNPDLPKADRVLCDVPCSGFGIIRRKPEIRYKCLDDIKGLYGIQYNILKTSAEYLKRGGRLVYSTCTLNKNENEKIAERFIKEDKRFKLIEMKTVFPSENGDGFFYAVMEKFDE